MHDKSLSLCLIHNVGGQQLMDNEEPIVWHVVYVVGGHKGATPYHTITLQG